MSSIIRRRRQQAIREALQRRQGQRPRRIPAMEGRRHRGVIIRIHRRRTLSHVRRQRRHAANTLPQAIRHHRHREHIRRHSERRGEHARRVVGHAPERKHRGRDWPGRVQAVSRQRARHRGHRQGQPAGVDPERGNDATVRPRQGRGGDDIGEERGGGVGHEASDGGHQAGWGRVQVGGLHRDGQGCRRDSIYYQ